MRAEVEAHLAGGAGESTAVTVALRRRDGRGRGGRRRARATVLQARRTVLGGPTQPVPTYAATGRRPTRAAAKTCPAVSDDLPYAGSPCLPAEPARGDLFAAGLPTARRGSSSYRSRYADSERQHRETNEHLASGHGLTSCVEAARVPPHHPLTSAPATRRREHGPSDEPDEVSRRASCAVKRQLNPSCRRSVILSATRTSTRSLSADSNASVPACATRITLRS